MMTINLESDIAALDQWTGLQAELCMNVANAKYYAFIDEAARVAEWVRVGFISRTTGADYLHAAAVYNQLYFEYGRDAIQQIMADAFHEVAA